MGELCIPTTRKRGHRGKGEPRREGEEGKRWGMGEGTSQDVNVRGKVGCCTELQKIYSKKNVMDGRGGGGGGDAG